LLDLLIRLDRLHEDEIAEAVRQAVATGVFRGESPGLFTTAYFHLPSELSEEVAAAGFESAQLLDIEGPGFMVPDFEVRWADRARRQAMLEAARLVETEPTVMGASSHLMAVARAPDVPAAS
jgi:hypothetical protein